ncbi:MAG: peptide-N-glycosidase F-related protein, partial [Bacteroidia bacterium]
WYSNLVRFEIGRYITPYGIGLDLGPDGKTWYYDVTDYAPLLHDFVRLQSGNNQELHNLRFLMIKGEPARDVKRIQNVYDGNWSFVSIANGTNAAEKTLNLDPAASAYRLKTRTTGHGFNGAAGTNCAEFCARDHSLNIDGQERFKWLLWDECSYNPLGAQGGTWIFDRAGWCPGEKVTTYDWELTPYVQPGADVDFDYEIDDQNRQPEGNWVLRTQLVSYGQPNHQLDISIEDVVAPNSKLRHTRWNPICGKPRIVIKNRGTDTLRSCMITFGIKNNGLPCYFDWTGELGFLEEEEVELNRFTWDGAGSGLPAIFYAEVSMPNGQADGYDRNNYIESKFEIPPAYNGKVAVEFLTNRRNTENQWYVYNSEGRQLRWERFFSTSRLNVDTLDLEKGCYTFLLTDSGNDGLDFWYNRAQTGSGSLEFKDDRGRLLERFDPDFGGEIRHSFTIGYTVGLDDEDDVACYPVGIRNELAALDFAIYPNPTEAGATLTLSRALESAGTLKMYDAMGKLVLEKTAPAGSYHIDIEANVGPGVYWLELRSEQAVGQKTLVVK